MNKQEVIEELEYLKRLLEEGSKDSYNNGFINALKYTLNVVKQLKEQEKPKVPQFVADWIEYCKANDITLLGSLDPIAKPWEVLTDVLVNFSSNDGYVGDCITWLTRNQDTFARAWLFGYEVKKEKQYVVAIPDDERNKFIQLWKNRKGKLLFNFEDKIRYGKLHLLTEQEIKQKDERLWKFAKEVE